MALTSELFNNNRNLARWLSDNTGVLLLSFTHCPQSWVISGDGTPATDRITKGPEMTKRLIATVLAGVLALTSVPATPAQANDDLGKLLAAGTAIFIIGKVIEQESKKSSRKKEVHHHHYRPAPVKKKKKVHRHYAPAPVHKKKKAHRHHHGHRAARLPGYCLTQVNGWDGPRKILSGRCIRNNYDYADSLPRNCRRHVETYQGLRRGWAPHCLRKHGYVIAGL